MDQENGELYPDTLGQVCDSESHHDGDNYADPPISFTTAVVEGARIECPKDVKDSSGRVIGHDSRSRHEDPADAREEVARMASRFLNDGG